MSMVKDRSTTRIAMKQACLKCRGAVRTQRGNHASPQHIAACWRHVWPAPWPPGASTLVHQPRDVSDAAADLVTCKAGTRIPTELVRARGIGNSR